MNIFELTRILNEAKTKKESVKVPQELKATETELKKTANNFVKDVSGTEDPETIEQAEIALRRAESFIEDKNVELTNEENDNKIVRKLFIGSYEKLKKIGLYRQWMDKVIKNPVNDAFGGISDGKKISFREINPLFTPNFIPLLYSFRGGNNIARGSGEFLMRLVFGCLGIETEVAKKVDDSDIKTGDIKTKNVTYEIKANNGRLDSMSKSTPEQLVEKIARLVKIFIDRQRFDTKNGRVVNRTSMSNEQFSKYVLKSWFQTVKENGGQNSKNVKLILVNKEGFLIISEDTIEECVKHLKLSIPRWMVDKVLENDIMSNGGTINIKDISLDRTIKISLK